MQIYPFLPPCTKVKSKVIMDFHIRADTLKLTKESEKKPQAHGHRGKSPDKKSNRSKIDKWGFKNCKSSVRSKYGQ